MMFVIFMMFFFRLFAVRVLSHLSLIRRPSADLLGHSLPRTDHLLLCFGQSGGNAICRSGMGLPKWATASKPALEEAEALFIVGGLVGGLVGGHGCARRDHLGEDDSQAELQGQPRCKQPTTTIAWGLKSHANSQVGFIAVVTTVCRASAVRRPVRDTRFTARGISKEGVSRTG
jgi:hypothetical protein